LLSTKTLWVLQVRPKPGLILTLEQHSFPL
jgi:hypothetical protein